MSMKSKLGMLATMSLMMGGLDGFPVGGGSEPKKRLIDLTPKEPPIPNGCQRFYYNSKGICSKSESEVHFDAMKPSSAFKKYQRWLSNKTNKQN